MKAFNKSFESVIKEYDSDAQKGLSSKQVEENTLKYGKNELKAKKKQSLIVKFLLQFTDLMIIILIIAAVVSIIIDPKEWVDSLIIFIVITINAIIGVVQESRAEKSLEALEKMSTPLCKVIRDGSPIQIKSRDLVPGDIILFEAGDYVSADSRIIEYSSLQIDESALTGESVPVTKNNEVIEKEDVALGDMKNMIFSSTFVTKGRGKAVVVDTGMNTEIGKIAGMLTDTEVQKTPLQNKLNQVSKVIGILCIVICVVVFALQYISTHNALDSFKTAVALAVAAIPEGLATVVTIVLALGVNEMSKRNAIVKRLPAVETLGCTSVVCSDKTGTLTQNKMTVVEVYNEANQKIRKTEALDENDINLVAYFALCCDAKVSIVDGVEERIGDPTETALIDLNNKKGMDISTIERVADVPFDSDRKLMTVIVKMNGKYLQITKGAPDIIIKNSINFDKLSHVLDVNNNMAVRALRVLGLGIRIYDNMPKVVDESIEKNLEFIGLVGMIDPSRPEVKDAIYEAKKAGIRTIMITGDHKVTAEAIAKDLGIMEEGMKAISSDELSKLSDEYLDEHIEEYCVYARVAPEDKVRIVKSWQKKGKIVAMTGDGVNDSPALKTSDIGCAMGITGTDVAKEAASMILVDDNFATIISAVKQGRGIYDNVKKCVKYLLSSNIGEVLTIFLASLIAVTTNLALQTPLSPIHLLWINLITDSLPAFGLGMEKPDADVMKRKPRPNSEGFFANKLGIHIALEGVMIGLLTLVSYIIGSLKLGHMAGQTMAFVTLSFCQLFHAFNVKSDHTIFSKETFNNKTLNLAFIIGAVLQFVVMYTPFVHDSIFKLTSLNITYLLIAIGLGFVTVIVMEIVKLINRKSNK